MFPGSNLALTPERICLRLVYSKLIPSNSKVQGFLSKAISTAGLIGCIGYLGSNCGETNSEFGKVTLKSNLNLLSENRLSATTSCKLSNGPCRICSRRLSYKKVANLPSTIKGYNIDVWVRGSDKYNG